MLHPSRTEPVPLPPDPHRSFLHATPCPRCKGSGRVGGYSGDPDEWEDNAWTCSDCRATGTGPDSRPSPVPSAAHICAITTAPSAPEAEAHAWDLAFRLTPWGLPIPDRLIWRVPTSPVNAFEPSLEGVPRSVTSQVSALLLNQWDLADPTIDIATPYGTKPQPYIDLHYQARLHSAWGGRRRIGPPLPASRPLVRRSCKPVHTPSQDLADRLRPRHPDPHHPHALRRPEQLLTAPVDNSPERPTTVV